MCPCVPCQHAPAICWVWMVCACQHVYICACVSGGALCPGWACTVFAGVRRETIARDGYLCDALLVWGCCTVSGLCGSGDLSVPGGPLRRTTRDYISAWACIYLLKGRTWMVEVGKLQHVGLGAGVQVGSLSHPPRNKYMHGKIWKNRVPSHRGMTSRISPFVEKLC